MFADLTLARRIDGAEGSLSADIADAVIRRGAVAGAFSRAFSGGVAIFTGADSPINKIIGAGFDGAPDPRDLAALEAAYFAVGGSVRAEVSTLADPAFVQHLTAGGYVLNGFENVLGRSPGSRPDGSRGVPEGVTVEAATDAQVWMRILLDGFASPDTGVVSAPGEPFDRPAVERLFEDMAGARGFTRYIARVDAEAAGAGSMRMSGGIAQLCGAATLPPFRRRGLQTALLHARLADAAAAGCDVAVVTTEPGSRSQQNVQRAGFALLYSRAVLIKAAAAPGT
jgi:GNAT superfamily N-acetyltransferase